MSRNPVVARACYLGCKRTGLQRHYGKEAIYSLTGHRRASIKKDRRVSGAACLDEPRLLQSISSRLILAPFRRARICGNSSSSVCPHLAE
jgi:hypothetical protein